MQLAKSLFRGALSGLKNGFIVAILFLIDCLVIRTLFGGGGNVSLVKSFAPVKPPATLLQFLVCGGCFIALIAVTVAGACIGYIAWPTAWGSLIGSVCAYASAWACCGALSSVQGYEGTIDKNEDVEPSAA